MIHKNLKDYLKIMVYISSNLLNLHQKEKMTNH